MVKSVRVIPKNGFPKRQHLKKTDEFSSVFNFKCRIRGKYFQVMAKPNLVGYPRLGIVVSKKNDRRAVSRNYMRRVIRDTFRVTQQHIGGFDLVVQVVKSFFRPDFQIVREELQEHFCRLHKCRESSSKS